MVPRLLADEHRVKTSRTLRVKANRFLQSDACSLSLTNNFREHGRKHFWSWPQIWRIWQKQINGWLVRPSHKCSNTELNRSSIQSTVQLSWPEPIFMHLENWKFIGKNHVSHWKPIRRKLRDCENLQGLHAIVLISSVPLGSFGTAQVSHRRGRVLP